MLVKSNTNADLLSNFTLKRMETAIRPNVNTDKRLKLNIDSIPENDKSAIKGRIAMLMTTELVPICLEGSWFRDSDGINLNPAIL